MNPLAHVSNWWGRNRTRFDTASLQLRLIAMVLASAAIALLSYKLFSHWSIQTVLMMNSGYLSTAQFLQFAEQLVSLGLIVISGMAIALLTGVWLLLRPLNHFKHWVETRSTDSFNARYATRELRVLAKAWNSMLDQRAAIKHQQRQFITNVAHELRSPLSVVYGYLQRTAKRSTNLPVMQQESLDMATLEAERLTLILQDLIDLARAESLDIGEVQEPLILNEFVRDVATMTEKFDHANLQMDISPFPIRVQTHRDYLMQVLNHLIQNAIQYSETDSPITIRLKQVNDTAIIQVSDRGEGIPHSQQALVFEPFHRIDPSRSRATGGTGLGLAIVKVLVEKMGGCLSLDSEPGIGTTFTVTLPTLGQRL
jgi:signal transduction histidine kinase